MRKEVTEVPERVGAGKQLNRIAVWGAIVLVALLALVVFVGSIMEYNSLREERRGIEREIERVNQSVERYQHDLDAPMDDEYIESVAKDKLDLIDPDEELVHNGN